MRLARLGPMFMPDQKAVPLRPLAMAAPIQSLDPLRLRAAMVVSVPGMVPIAEWAGALMLAPPGATRAEAAPTVPIRPE